MTLIDTLRTRGYVHQITDERGLNDLLESDRVGAYCGFDPTADSLQIGNLVPIMMLRHVQMAGHSPVVVQGGMTGLIGDPSGKSEERRLLDREAVAANVAAQAPIFESFLSFDPESPNRARRLDNLEWLGTLTATELLRDFGKHVSVNQMLQRDNVRHRLERPDQGISFTEFSYGILQAIDFAHLFRHHGVSVQIGGSDQWGNIVGGIDFVRRLCGGAAFGLTTPLVTRADGQKFGKTEKGSIWLSAGRTSPFAYFQFWLNSTDEDVSSYLRRFTLLGLDEIQDVEKRHATAVAHRIAQRRLAVEATALLHGIPTARSVERASSALFSGDAGSFTAEDMETLAGDLPVTVLDLSSRRGVSVVDALIASGLASSKREAREFIVSGAVRVGDRVARPHEDIGESDLVGGFALLSRGKRERRLLKLIRRD